MEKRGVRNSTKDRITPGGADDGSGDGAEPGAKRKDDVPFGGSRRKHRGFYRVGNFQFWRRKGWFTDTQNEVKDPFGSARWPVSMQGESEFKRCVFIEVTEDLEVNFGDYTVWGDLP